MRNKSFWSNLVSRVCAVALALAFTVAIAGCAQTTSCCGKCDGQAKAACKTTCCGTCGGKVTCCGKCGGKKACAKKCKKAPAEHKHEETK
jgi:hypothetical protein